MIIFHDTLGVYGGSQTLMLRMCQWLRQNEIGAAVICRSDDNEEIVQKLRACGTKVIRLDVRDSAKTESLFRMFQDEEKELFVVNFIWNYYLDLERFKQVTGMCFSNGVYAIHPNTFKKGMGIRLPVLRRTVQCGYRKILERMNKIRAVYFMDEDVLSATQDYLGTTLRPEPPLFPIPMFCREREDAGSIVEKGYQSRILLTASRAEFPYKGYLLGLIEDYRALKEHYLDIKLEVVTGGLEADVAVLRQKLEELPENCRRDVIFHHWMDYDALLREMENCTLFVGMGTSVLDAALAYKPAIPVRYNTYQTLADSLLSDCPQEVCASADCRSPARGLMESVLEMSPEAYREASFASFQQVKRHYDVDKVMGAMLKNEPLTQESILTFWGGAWHQLYNWINRTFHREKERFGINDIKKEQ